MTTEIDHHRRSIRLREYDYSRAGAYFVTICSWERECRFGEVVDGEMRLNGEGEIIREEWLRTEIVRKEVELGEYVVMPNHVHGIVRIIDTVGAHGVRPIGGAVNELIGCASSGCNASSGRTPCAPTMNRAPKSLGSLVAGLKSAVTKRINIIRGNPGGPVWQRNYYEHVIRNEADYQRIAEYIENNPTRWAEDSLHPSKQP